MARIRQIKPEFFLDDELAQCSRDARLLFPGLWILADRAGRLENRPARIKAQIFPYDDDIDAAGLSELLTQLEARRFILIYEVDGRSYIQIRTFEKHQHCHRNELPSQIPAPAPDGVPGTIGRKRRATTESAPDSPDPAYSGKDAEHSRESAATPEDSRALRPIPEHSGEIPSTRDTYTYTNTPTSTHTSGEAADAALAKTPEVLVAIYKAENRKLPQILEFGPERKNKCKHRLAKNPRKFIDQFTRAVMKAQETPFLRGEGDRGWKADFDWFVANDHNVVRVLEGRYDSARASPGGGTGTAFEKIRRERQEGRNGSDRVA